MQCNAVLKRQSRRLLRRPQSRCVLFAVVVTHIWVACTRGRRASSSTHNLSSGQYPGTATSANHGKGRHHYYALLINDAASFRDHLNQEYSQVIGDLVALAGGGAWRLLALPPPPTAVKSTSWASIASQALRRFRTLPRALLLPIKFHSNYGAIARLGPRRNGVLQPEMTRIVAYVDDLHWFDANSAKEHRTALAGIDVVLATYAYLFTALYPGLGVMATKQGQHRRHQQQLAWVPHATTAEMFQAISLQESDKSARKAVLLSGATAQEWYPYRHALELWIQQERDARYLQLVHPGYPHEGDSRTKEEASRMGSRGHAKDINATVSYIGRDYALRLNRRHAACLTDGLHLDYVVAKMLEFPAAGCVMLVNAEMRPMLAKMGLFPGVHFLVYRNPAVLDKLVDWVLDRRRNGPKIDAMRRRAQRIVWRRHIVAHRSALIDALVGITSSTF